MLEPDDPRHGTDVGYSYHRCRCDACRLAANAKRQRIRQQHKGSANTPHGTVNGYTNYLCRCAACRTAWSDYLRARKSRAMFAEITHKK